jgi:hypothetical protein
MTLDPIINSFMSVFEKNKQLYHDKYIINIPDIIDPLTDKRVWDNLYELLYIYFDMIQEFIYIDDELELFTENWINYFNKLRKECDDANKLMLLSIYLHSQYECMLDWCLKNEYYEGAANLKKFNELL